MYLVGTFDPLEVLAFLSLWYSLYWTLRWLNPDRTPEWHCRVVTVTHALVISALGFYSSFVQGPWPFTHAGGPSNDFQVHVVALCLAYFMFDVSWSLYFQTEGAVMLVHHCVSLIGLSWSLLSGSYGTEIIATIAGAEVTNPLLQARWFLRATGRHHTLLSDAIEWMFMLAFGAIRLGVGSVLLYRYYQQDTTYFGRIGGTSIYVISVIFFVNIVSYAVKKYTMRYKAWVKRRKGKNQNQETKNNRRVKVPDSDRGVKERSAVDPKTIGVVSDTAIPGPRELKLGLEGLTVRSHCMVTKEH